MSWRCQKAINEHTDGSVEQCPRESNFKIVEKEKQHHEKEKDATGIDCPPEMVLAFLLNHFQEFLDNGSHWLPGGANIPHRYRGLIQLGIGVEDRKRKLRRAW